MSTEQIEAIKEYAFKCHAGQTYGDRPYSAHLEEVDAVIKKFASEFSAEEYALLCKCSWLHDAIEDTDTTAAELEKLFGLEVADLIYKVSDEEGRNRKERKAKTYPKIASSDMAIALKLADRIANLENCIKTKSSLLDMYRKEQEEFKKHLFNGRFISMWKHIEYLITPAHKADGTGL